MNDYLNRLIYTIIVLSTEGPAELKEKFDLKPLFLNYYK